VEVGTTNRTYVADYERAIGPETAALLRVHPSNFRMVGFTVAPPLGDLAALGERHRLPVLEDLGSGALLETERFGLDHEPTLRESVAAGVSVVMASGDKLLGGPQAGILIGRRHWIDHIAKHPLARAVRADKTCLAGLAATLRHYLRGDAVQEVPVWQMIATTRDELEARARKMREGLRRVSVEVMVVDSEATVGGGSLPGQTLPSRALRFVPSEGRGCDELSQRLRLLARDPVFGRTIDGGMQFDLRTVSPHQDAALTRSLREVLANAPAS
jgi:L-seryl-tRNA(Ser) seleniumtransferase